MKALKVSKIFDWKTDWNPQELANDEHKQHNVLMDEDGRRSRRFLRIRFDR